MAPVRVFFVDNLLGDLQSTLSAAKTVNGAVYPVGSVVQLVPTEVMVKWEKGYNAVTKDWEFFELGVSEMGSEITVRGAFEVVNKFGGNCFGCYIKAKPEFDLICEHCRIWVCMNTHNKYQNISLQHGQRRFCSERR